MSADEKIILLRNKLNTAIDSIGIYPASITRDGYTITRGDYGNGWNDCAMKILEKLGRVIDEIDNEDFNPDLQLLLLSERAVQMKDKIVLNMNDTFYYACADAEKLPEDKISEAAELFKRFGDAGLIYWVSQVRNEIPQIPEYAKDVEHVALQLKSRKR